MVKPRNKKTQKKSEAAKAPQTERIYVTFKQDVIEKIRKVAEREHRTQSAQIAFMVDQQLKLEAE